VDYAISVMKQKRIRHLPIVEGKQVVSIVSMRDLLDLQLSGAKAEIHYAGLLRRRPQRPFI
jgi:CBS domain-containing protein